nr:choice-of-anchor D domain-containing protein [Bacteroidales bacterium]
MKKIGLLFEIVAAGLLLSLTGCEEENVPNTLTSQTIYADIEEDGLTKVSLEQDGSGRDLVAKWQNDDKISVFLLGNEYCDVGDVTLKSINSGGKGCVFSYDIPESFSRPVEGYRLLCFTSNNRPVLQDVNELTFIPEHNASWSSNPLRSSTKGKKSKDLVLMLNASITRAPLSQYRAPVMFNGFVSRESEDVSFSHYFTYELLHVNNVTDSPITFSLLGFVGTLWFRERGSICLDDGRFAIYSDATKEPVKESSVITIPAHSSDIIVSSYIPNGQMITDAQLVARVNGNEISSTNKLSSTARLQKGHAYHMYISWDGKDLSFDGKYSVQVSPVDIDFGAIPVGSRDIQTVNVTNTGREPLLVSNIQIEGDASEFSVAEWSWKGQKLAAGSAKTVNIAFKPTKNGKATARLIFTTEAGVKTVNLTGHGGQPDTPVMSVDPDRALDFGSLVVGKHLKKTITISNVGTGKLNVTSISLRSGKDGFKLAPWIWKGKPIEPDNSSTIDVIFEPSANGKVEDALTISSNAGECVITLNGTGLNEGKPVLAVEPATLKLDFGEVVIGSDNRQTITITNKGTGDLFISEISLAVGSKNGFQRARWDWEGETIAPGQSQEIGIRFYPSEEGSFSDKLNIVSNAGNKVVALTGKGVKEGTPELQVSPATLSFDDVVVGENASDFISISNVGSKPMTVSSITLENSNLGFSIASWTWKGSKLSPGATKRIQLDFSPKQVGNVSTKLTIVSDGGRASVAISGFGLSADKPAIGVSPESLDFGEITIGERATRTVTIKNVGKADLLMSSIKLSEGAYFSFEWSWKGQTLAPGKSADIQVSFSPKAAKEYSDWLNLAGKNADPRLVVVKGTGVDKGKPDIEVSPTSLAFGNVSIGESSSKTFSIKNTGSANLIVTKIEIGSGTGQYTVSPASMTVNPGASKTVTVTFKPTSTGSKPGTVAITADDIPSTKAVILSGTGVLAAAPIMTLSPLNILAFGNVNIGSRKDMVVTVKNTGYADLVVSSAMLANRTAFLIGASEWQGK